MAWNIENIEVDDDIMEKWEHGRCVILTII